MSNTARFCYLICLIFLPFLSHSQTGLDSLKEKSDSAFVNYIIAEFRTKIITQGADVANDIITKGARISKNENWKKVQAYCEMYGGICDFYLGNFDDALAHYITSSNLFDSLQLPEGIAKVSNEMGVFYSKQENREKAFEYWEKAETAGEKASSMEDIGTSISNRGMNHLKYNEFDEAYPYLIKALNIREELEDSVGMGYELKRIATYYFGKEQQEKGEQYLKLSNEIREKIGDLSGLAVNQVTLAEVFFQQAKYDKAVVQFENTLALSKQINFLDLERYTYGMIQRCYQELGNYYRAFQYLEKEKAFSDSILNSEKQKAILEMQAKYENAQKKTQIALQEATIVGQQNTIILIGSGSGLLILIGLIFFHQNRTKQNEALFLEKEKGFNSVIQATEEERSRISKDLHDGIGQQLSGLKLGLNALSEKITDERIKSQMQEITASFSQSADEVRHISHQMMPRALAEKGLIVATEELLKNAFQFSDTKFQLEHDGINERLPERIEISIYRVIQELINNIIKHAKASQVNVQFILNNNQLMIFLEDDGKGFDHTTDFQGHGLLNIKSRVNMIKGTVNFEPGPHAGTFVSITIPTEKYA